jgi:hypothetical protein
LYWYCAETGIAVVVGNLPLCKPILHAVFGWRDSSAASYEHRSYANSRRRKASSRDPLSIPGDTNIDKMDYNEHTMGLDEQASDGDSQIELVIQKNEANAFGGSLVGGSTNKNCAVNRTQATATNGTGTARQNNNGKIMVVTTVDVSHGSEYDR